MMFSFREIFDIIIMSLILGFIFSDIFKREHQVKKEYDEDYNPIEDFRKKYEVAGIRWEGMLFAMAITAPAVILHEFGHKFVAMSYGYQATFHAAYFWLALGFILKLMNSPVLFFVPAFVSYPAAAAPLESSLIAFAGPLVNLLIFAAVFLVLRYAKVEKKYIPFLVLTRNINLFLFLFNMIPLTPFDGGHVFSGLINAFI